MTFEKLLEAPSNAPVKCADGKVGLLISWFDDTKSAGVQVPGEDGIREIPAIHLRDLGNGALEEEII